MDWLWIVAIAWCALAVPIALAAGRYVRRLDRADARRRLEQRNSLSTGGEPTTAPSAIRRGRSRRLRGHWAGRSNRPEVGPADAAQPSERGDQPLRVREGAHSPAGHVETPGGHRGVRRTTSHPQR